MTSKTLFDAKEPEQTNIPLEAIDSSFVNASSQSITSNAKAIADHTVFGVNHLVNLKIIIEGTECLSIKQFQLNQCIKGHHTFELSLHHNALGESETYQMVHTQELLGKRILVRFQFKNTAQKPERDFVGIITEVSFEQKQGSHGDIILCGYSPTILLDKAPHIQSFGGTTPISLPAVVHTILEEGYTQKGKYKYAIQSSNPVNLSYSCQYNETTYNYLARMAEAYGEQFFYDGETLHFGDIPSGQPPISLTYGRDIDQVKVSLAVQQVNREFYGYNSLNHKLLSATGDTNLQVKGTLAKAAYEKSQRVFTTPSLQVAPIKATTNQEVTQVQKGCIGSEGMSVFVITGTTTVPFLYPGCTIELHVVQSQSKENQYFTKLMITSVQHEVDALGTYRGHFEAVDADTGFIPRIAYEIPVIEQQIATVINNADPQNKGRVQVRFDWQEVDENTAFIRVMTPDAGHSSVVDKNRGLLTIPEIGDQVLVGFINQNPDRPIVMGSLFHGEIGAGGGVKNRIKSWSSKSGHIIELDDEGGIKIIDKHKNFIELDGEGTLLLKSSKAIKIQSGKSNLVLEENGKITLEGEELLLKGQTISHVASTKLVEQSGNAMLTLDAEGNEAQLTSKVTTIDGTSTVTISGGLHAKLTADGTAAIEGAIVKLN